MASAGNFQRTMAATAIFMALSLTAAHADDTAYFKDVLRPGGHARSMAAKLADGQACGVSGGRITGLMPAFEKCMSGRGWALDHYAADSAPRPGDTAVHFTDVKGNAGQPRDNAALQTDTRVCDAGGKDLESAGFVQCMLGRGWQFTLTQHAPAPPQQSNWAWSNADTSSSGANNDDFIRGNDDSNRANQEASDAINAASQATADSNAAAAAQQQLDSTLANAPIPSN